MEIRNTSNNPPQIDTQTAGEAGRGTRTGGASAGSTGSGAAARAHADRVTLTDAAQRLLQRSDGNSEAPVDQSKVTAVREAIAEGRYTADAAKIAARLVDLHNPPKT